MHTVLVVGGAGYVGALLNSELLERGYAVRVLDRMLYGEEGLRGIRDRIEVVPCDMRRIEPAHLAGVDTLINVGGLSNDPTAEYDPAANYELNTVATVRLAEMARDVGVRRYIFASSCSIYDRSATDDASDVVYDESSEVQPRAAYATSKYDAERQLLEMAGADFCPVILRKGTIFGYSPRMRFDLVVNTFLRDALTSGVITIFAGGEMWRPILDIRDAARAYIACVAADESLVHGQVFNVAKRNIRISELALRVASVLREMKLPVEINADYTYRAVRSYRVSTAKIERVLGFRAVVSVEDAVRDMATRLHSWKREELLHPRYENLRWLRILQEAETVLGGRRSVLSEIAEPSGIVGVVRRRSAV